MIPADGGEHGEKGSADNIRGVLGAAKTALQYDEVAALFLKI
jgi:hypothetical protein